MGSGGWRRWVVALAASALVLPASGCADAWQRVRQVQHEATGTSRGISPQVLVADLQDRARAHETVSFWLAGDVVDGGGFLAVDTPDVKAELTIDGEEWTYLLLDGHAYSKAADPWDAPWVEVVPGRLGDLAELPLDPVRHLQVWADQAVAARELEAREEGGVPVRVFRLDLTSDGATGPVSVDVVVDRTGLLQRTELWMDGEPVQTTGYEDWDAGLQLVAPDVAPAHGRV